MNQKQVSLNLVLPSEVHKKLMELKLLLGLSNQHEAVAKAIEVAYDIMKKGDIKYAHNS